jgi:hypothetical protein
MGQSGTRETIAMNTLTMIVISLLGPRASQ